MSPEQMVALARVVESFITAQNITCSETIYQMDRVSENSPEFIERLCDIAGYSEEA